MKIYNKTEGACTYKVQVERLTEKNKAIIKDIPNSDVDVFCDITGIDKEDVIS